MGRMEEYYLWKKGELNKKMSETTLNLFRTTLDDEQLIALEKYDKRTLYIVVIGLISYLTVGFLYGYLVGAFYG